MVTQSSKDNLQPGGPGRPKGSKNKRTQAIEIIAQGLLEDETYQKSLKRRLAQGKAPHMETLLHHYAYGKPIERVRVGGEDGGPIQVTDPFVHALMQVWNREQADASPNGHHAETSTS